MNLCATCVYWNELEKPAEDTFSFSGYPDYYTGEGLKRAAMPGRWGECNKVIAIEIEEKDKEAKFFVEDAEEYLATLKTRHDFGCTEHQTKETR